MFTILLFIPNFVSTDTELYGFVNKLTKWTIAFYVLKEGDINLGYSGKKWQKIQKSPNWIHFYYNCNNEIVIREIVIQGESINFKLPDVQLVAIKYNYNEFMKTNFISWESNPYINNNCYFLTLLNTIRKNKLSQQKCRKSVPMLVQLLSLISFYFNCIITWLNTDIFLIKLFQYSAIYTHIISWLNTIKLFIDNMFLGKDVNVKIIHLFVAYLVDICMGIIVIYCIKDWQYIMITSVFDSVQIIVTQVRDILEWLMGSPVGLKLNYAFNATMGQFFLYDIMLWWSFLGTISPLLSHFLWMLRWLGSFGISFLIALLEDLFALATFHVYCIYVYAATFYRFQMNSLSSLWRLFLGRKYNPLRKRVDSCEYTHRQLFVGTLTFTILLFLLPTTSMYYAVFSTLRLCLMLINGVLARIRFTLQQLPLYITILWFLKSPYISSTIHLKVKNRSQTQANLILLEVFLKPQSWWQTINRCLPKDEQKHLQFGNVVHSLLVGKLL